LSAYAEEIAVKKMKESIIRVTFFIG